MTNGNFTYNRTWVQIETMLEQAERLQNKHILAIQETRNKKKRIQHMRNYKALRWTLGDKDVEHPLE